MILYDDRDEHYISVNRLSLLQQSNLLVNWTIIGRGWCKKYLSSEELVRYAMEQIGYSSQEEAPVVSELAFTDPDDYWTIQRLVMSLMPDNYELLQIADRAWRAVIFEEVLSNLSAKVKRSCDNRICGRELDDLNTHVYCTIRDFVDEYKINLCEVSCLWQTDDIYDYNKHSMEYYRRWLVQEINEINALIKAGVFQ